MSDPSIACLGAFGRLPPEVRIMVYDEIFGPTKVIIPIYDDRGEIIGDELLQPALYTKAPVQTSILATNKRVFQEAVDTLYRHRTVRGYQMQLVRLLHNKNFRELVESIEIVIDVCYGPFSNPGSAQNFLLQLQTLTRIPSITILSDDWAPSCEFRSDIFTVQEFTNHTGLGSATCVDIGRFQLNGRFSRIQILDRKLVKMWPDVVRTPDDYDVYADVLAIINANDSCLRMSNVPIWAAQTSLRRWVGLYQEVFRCAFSPDEDALLAELNAERRLILTQFQRSLLCLTHHAIENPVNIYEDRARGKPLKPLKLGDDPALLAWATDLLSINTTAYHSCEDQFRVSGDPRFIHWVEFRGGMHTLEIMKRHATAAASGQANAYYTPHPVFTNHVRETAVYHEYMLHHPHPILQHHDYDMDLDKIRQWCALHTAVYPGRYRAEYRRIEDKWAAQLFRRYLIVDPGVRADEARRATLEDMRKAMRKMLNSFGSLDDAILKKAARLRRNVFRLSRLHADLLPTVAWDYGRVFVDIWRATVKRRLRREQHSNTNVSRHA